MPLFVLPLELWQGKSSHMLIITYKRTWRNLDMQKSWQSSKAIIWNPGAIPPLKYAKFPISHIWGALCAGGVHLESSGVVRLLLEKSVKSHRVYCKNRIFYGKKKTCGSWGGNLRNRETLYFWICLRKKWRRVEHRWKRQNSNICLLQGNHDLGSKNQSPGVNEKECNSIVAWIKYNICLGCIYCYPKEKWPGIVPLFRFENDTNRLLNLNSNRWSHLCLKRFPPFWKLLHKANHRLMGKKSSEGLRGTE